MGRLRDDLGLGVLRFKFGFRLLAGFRDEEVAGFLADHGDGFALVSVSDDAIEAGGRGVGEGDLLVDFPEDLLHAFVGRAAERLNEFLGALIGDIASVAIHAALAAELVAEVLHADVATFPSVPEAERGGVKEVDGLAEFID